MQNTKSRYFPRKKSYYAPRRFNSLDNPKIEKAIGYMRQMASSIALLDAHTARTDALGTTSYYSKYHSDLIIEVETFISELEGTVQHIANVV